MKRVLHIARYGTIKGGAETYIATVTAGLRARGIETTLACALEADPHDDSQRLTPGLLNSDVESVRKLLKQEQPDLIHVHLTDQPWLLGELAAVAPVVLAIQDHRVDCPTGTRYHTRFRKVCTVTPGLKCLAYNITHHCGSLRANATLQPYKQWRQARDAIRASSVEMQVFSEHMADQVEAVIGRRPFVTHYPTPSVATIEARPTTRSQPDDLLAPSVTMVAATDARTRAELDRRPVIVASGRLNQEKGFRVLLDSMNFVKQPVHLIIIGDGHDRPALEKQASQTTGGHRITFTGWLDPMDRDHWLSKAVLTVVPSMWPEPFGIVGLESMAAGKPVIGFAVGGIPEWLQDGVNGKLVAAGDIVGLARAIDALLSDPGSVETMGRRGRQLAENDFNLDAHLDALISHYRRVIDAAEKRG
jgi:glycosyltransferase involved in cell wall biosynthesis